MAATTIISDNGDKVYIDQIDFSKRVDKVPPRIYRIRVNPDTGRPFLLAESDRYKVSTRRYGKHNEYKKMITSAFMETEGTLGALFNGLKGAGKTMLAEDICNDVLDVGMPVIFIDFAAPAALITAVAKQVGPCVIFFDEYGKFYKEDERSMMLAFFSSNELKKTLFLITTNSLIELNDFMIDRPSRFRYRINFGGVSDDVVTEMIEDLKLESCIVEYLSEYCKTHKVSYDVMNTIIRPATDSRTVKEFNDKLSVLNVPQAIHPFIRPITVTYNGEKWADEIVITEVDGDVTLTLYKTGSATPEYECKINWLTAKKVLINATTYNVDFDDAVSAKLDRCFQTHQPRAYRQMSDEASQDRYNRMVNRGPGDNSPNHPNGRFGSFGRQHHHDGDE